MRTQVGIIGAGPAGLLLSHLLHRHGIESVVLEARDRDYVQRRVRAGVLEQGTVDVLVKAGLGDRLLAQGLPHQGFELRLGDEAHRIDLTELTGGRNITVYGQQEVVKDLIDARLADGGTVLFEKPVASVHDLETAAPYIRCQDGTEVHCEFVVGADGFHGISRAAIPDARTYEFEFPFGWLGILADVQPSSEELIYAGGEGGFALHSMRSPEVTRCYLQVEPGDSVDNWPDERIWAELRTRLGSPGGWELTPGPITEKSITPMRSFVTEPMSHGRLFLAGDSAHIVPPTGAKGLNLAVGDVVVLAAALEASFQGDDSLLASYSDTCLRRIWKAQDFCAWMTGLLHRNPEADPFTERIRQSRLREIFGSPSMARYLAEHYAGYPHG
ncbi:4-hydroxybenzoate 3-monooxygenase [Pseudonocardiaceae bacterium YIM PH 21723]|nr:4-hydroxybenzoate 3-monooxygenase [Pseudonocardiaceae bacterium YIM PH 21723]